MQNIVSSLSLQALAQYIDHTLLRPEATESEILKICSEAREFGFKSVCVELKWLERAREALKGSAVLPITVIAFPKGNEATAEKVAQAKEAREKGAAEMDMVLNRELLFARQYGNVARDIQAVVEVAGSIPVKVILETSELTRDHKAIACALCQVGGAAFVKTSTGFSKSGATEEDVRLMRDIVGDSMGVKASGGIRTFADASRFINAGASRIGASASVSILDEARRLARNPT